MFHDKIIVHSIVGYFNVEGMKKMSGPKINIEAKNYTIEDKRYE